MLAKLKNKKGFTLVEVIVVLVILAILAAILIPTLTGYIDKANEKRIIAEARSLLMAARTELSVRYGENTLEAGTITITDDATNAVVITGDATASDATTDDDNNVKTTGEAIKTLAELPADGWAATITYDAEAKFKEFSYTASGKTAEYDVDAGTWSIS